MAVSRSQKLTQKKYYRKNRRAINVRNAAYQKKLLSLGRLAVRQNFKIIDGKLTWKPPETIFKNPKKTLDKTSIV